MLGDDAFLAGNEEAARRVDDQIDVLLRKTGLSRRGLVRVPVLYAMASPAPGVPEGAIAYSPASAAATAATATTAAAETGPRPGARRGPSVSA